MVFILNILSKIKDIILFAGAFILFVIGSTITSIKNKLSLIYTVVVTGKAGDLMVKPGLLQALFYLLTAPTSTFSQEIEPPGEYLISLVGFKSEVPNEDLIKWLMDNQYSLRENGDLVNMTRQDALNKINEIKNGSKYELARGVGLFRKEELIKLFITFNGVLEIKELTATDYISNEN